ncbi:preprotein translocase subunit SecG [Borrelia coriaceae]|uniref:Protein-export membrane protein SecG n=1 Tax=Borrelia coriaceae ATCC 43381 TaxID=1408429 RepID=W5STK9_9SPIR|nr:preprotein translocase subunit SecG [Borrelia coriaceae]AHH10207.1 Protein translocase subunit secG [Borrelia coriaceae ATCC 43381]UPA15932.1 preprotein translocase subunit SecG [Borrelia coriaceae]
MELLRFLIFMFFIITSFMIILLVLLQDEQGDGVGVFGGGSSSIFGAKSSSIVIRITAFFITIFFIFVIALSFINTKRVDNSLLKDVKTNETNSTFWNDDTNQTKDTVNEKTSDKEK